MYTVMLWDKSVRHYRMHHNFVSMEQAQKFVFYNLGYIADYPDDTTLYMEHPYDGCVRVMVMNDAMWEDYAIAFIDKVG